MSLLKDKHVRYWRMCSQTLPDHYISNDSSRMTLGFFTISALDLLNVLDTVQSDVRDQWISWIYSCQVPEGGFRGFTGTDLQQERSDSNRQWDPANLPATFFALTTLLVLGDDLSRVKRIECLEWLPKLQREDGSFGELLGENGTIEGDRDLRQCCCAAGIAYILQTQACQLPTFDEQRLIAYIRSCQNQSGGFGVSPLREPHSGLSYCAISALSFLQRIQAGTLEQLTDWIPAPDQCLHWFLERQTSVIDVEEDNDDGDTQQDQRLCPSPNVNSEAPMIEPAVAGFNGRDNKIADTCYSFWNAGSLAILEQESLIDLHGLRRHLLEVTQHPIGGFGKTGGDPPDVLHSYLGLAALALFKQPEIKTLDPTMCISHVSAARLAHLSWKGGS